MSIVVEGVYERGIVKLKTRVKAPNNSEVLVVFRSRTDKEKFLQSAGSWKDIDEGYFNDILKSRGNLRERSVEF